MRLVFLGLPGVGKGTQAKRCAEAYGVPHISTGDIFRDPAIMATPVGKQAKAHMDKGELVPDTIVVGIVKERLQAADCKQGFLFDGFPRTENQALELDKALAQQRRNLDAVVYLEAPQDVVIERLTGRRTCSNKSCGAIWHVKFSPPKREGVCDQCGAKLFQRDDDKLETVANRIKVYGEQTGTLVGYYKKRGLLKTVSGLAGPDEVYRAIRATLDK